MKEKTNKMLLIIVSLYFVLSAVLHFLRLTFSWDFVVGEYEVSTIISGACIIFSIIVAFFLIKMIRGDKKKKTEVVEEETDNN